MAAPIANIFFCEDVRRLDPHTTENIEIIFGNVSPASLPVFINLKWLQLATAGNDLYLDTAVLPKDVLLTNASEAYGENISEYMLCAILTHMQILHTFTANLQHYQRGEPLENIIVRK